MFFFINVVVGENASGFSGSPNCPDQNSGKNSGWLTTMLKPNLHVVHKFSALPMDVLVFSLDVMSIHEEPSNT
jgi:hypothetical protein